MEITLCGNNKFRFFIEDNYLVIKKRKWFSEKEIKRIEHSSIKKIDYNNPYTDISIFSKFLYSILRFVVAFFTYYGTYDNLSLWRTYLNITYIINGDKGIFRLDIKLSKKDYFELKKNLIKNF